MRHRLRESVLATGSRLILGLGNPGEQYRNTRHNLGFAVVDELARRYNCTTWRLRCNTLMVMSDTVDLGKPQTYMNRSGHAARCLVEQTGYEPQEILVIFDDVNLPLGKLRLRPRGTPGGHRGMESILARLQTPEIPRLRLGVGPDEAKGDVTDLVNYVLSPFSVDEESDVEELVRRGADAAEIWVSVGIEEAMNRCNG